MSKPKKVFKKGSVRVSIWANSKVIKGTRIRTYSATIDKVYKDGKQWKYTKSFSIEDLSKIVSAIDEAYQAFKKKNQRAIRRRKQRTVRNPLVVSSKRLTKILDDYSIDKYISEISNVFNVK